MHGDKDQFHVQSRSMNGRMGTHQVLLFERLDDQRLNFLYVRV
jgi:hypothetical protein